MNLFAELRRRNVFRVGIAYVLLGWVVLQGVDFALDLTDAPTWILQVFFIAGLAGLPIVLFLAWAFEITPEGIKREADVDRSASVTTQTGRRLDRAIIVFLVLVIVGMGIERFYAPGPGPGPASQAAQPAGSTPPPQGPAEADRPAPGMASSAATDAAASAAAEAAQAQASVAVLPFRAMSSGADDEYFADGLTEEILNSLAQLPELLVTARTSSFHFKDQDLPVPEIASQLGVDHVVEGSVRRAGEQVRITAQLIRAADGFHLWSQTYDRTLEDVFAVQEDIAASIAETLDVVLDEDKLEQMRRAGIRDVDAFIAFQKGREAFLEAHEDLSKVSALLAEANPWFERALEAAPDLVAARLLMADGAAHIVFDLAADIRPEAVDGEAEGALASVREELDEAWRAAPPGNQKDVLDAERTFFMDDWTGLGMKLDRALQPGECPRTNWLEEIALMTGRAEAVVAKTEQQLRCDPLNTMARAMKATGQIWTGNAEGSIRTVEKAQADGIAFSWLASIVYLARLANGEVDHPEVRAVKGPDAWIGYPREALRLSVSGDVDAARAVVEEYRTGPDANDWSALVASAVVGDRERANEYAARIDARPGAGLVLGNAVYSCLCGAPFDLEATPNFAQRIEEAGIPWPPRKIIDVAAKDW
jgi:TolB-like protein